MTSTERIDALLVNATRLLANLSRLLDLQTALTKGIITLAEFEDEKWWLDLSSDRARRCIDGLLVEGKEETHEQAV